MAKPIPSLHKPTPGVRCPKCNVHVSRHRDRQYVCDWKPEKKK